MKIADLLPKIYTTLLRKIHMHEAQASRGTERSRDGEQTFTITDVRTKKCNRGTPWNSQQRTKIYWSLNYV